VAPTTPPPKSGSPKPVPKPKEPEKRVETGEENWKRLESQRNDALALITQTLDLPVPCTLDVAFEEVAAHFDKDAAWKNRCGEVAALWLKHLQSNLAAICGDATIKVVLCSLVSRHVWLRVRL
jgi:hypothetical protein